MIFIMPPAPTTDKLFLQKFSSQFIAFDSITAENCWQRLYELRLQCRYFVFGMGHTRSGKMNIYFVKTIASNNATVAITALQGEAMPWSISPILPMPQ